MCLRCCILLVIFFSKYEYTHHGSDRNKVYIYLIFTKDLTGEQIVAKIKKRTNDS